MEKPMGESVKELIGREKEKEEIIDQLVLLSRSGDSPVPVISISGLAGIGKTELARHVCQDEKLREQVGLPALVDAHEYVVFDADIIAKQVIRSVGQETTTKSLRPTNDLNIIVILDNWRVRIEEKDVKELQTKVRRRWKKEIEDMDLKNAVARVRAIIITTRNSFLVRDIGDIPVKSYPLAGLDEKESALLLEKALGRDASDKVSTKNIVMQCSGVPLAIIAMAERHRDSSGASTPKEQLMYSYYEVGEGFPHQCFAYFSLFPQNFSFDAERLIHLWMAEGFLGSEPEKTGRQYLRDLVGRSMFQDVKEDEFGEVRSFKLHPLMHDKARFFVADREKSENITVNPSVSEVHSKIKRVSFDLSLDFPGGIPAPLSAKAKQLKTLLFFANTRSQLPRDSKMRKVLENILKSFKNLQVLNLRGLEITTVPSSIGELKELKYLDLSQNNMKTLPSSIAKLSNLETLKLSGCLSLKELPKDFKKLTRLKHLDIEGCRSLSRMPSHLGTLETLSAFVANKDVNNIVEGLCKLAELKTLRRRLEIVYRNRMQQFSEKNIKPQTKLLVEDLTLRWDLETGQNTDKPDKSLDLLRILETHSELRVLVLEGYKSSGLPAWFASSFENLVKLSLQDCPGCNSLNCQDKLPKLRILELIRLDNLEYVEEQCRKDAVFYKTLEELKISGCPKLESWWQNKEVEEKDRPVFRCISKLHVHDCPKLTCMPLYPRLKDSTSSSFNKEMVLEGSSLKLLLDKPVGSAQDCNIPLENLQIQKCFHLENLCSAFQQLSSLQRLTIESCAEANICGSGNQWKGLESLRFLTLRVIPTLSSLSFGNSDTILRELTIHRCQSLTSIDSISKLTSLRRLEISECNNLKSLPKEMKKLQSLKTLIILNCKWLLLRCQPETGDDWPHIRHITNKRVQ